ncbi:unnamed protein product [Leptosia nina]|uniref:Uncharacterized protein n=1 Tax=Leptosia nina TaxID=320188 RepID=A0AAV1K0U1_9NEOP
MRCEHSGRGGDTADAGAGVSRVLPRRARAEPRPRPHPLDPPATTPWRCVPSVRLWSPIYTFCTNLFSHTHDFIIKLVSRGNALNKVSQKRDFPLLEFQKGMRQAIGEQPENL